MRVQIKNVNCTLIVFSQCYSCLSPLTQICFINGVV